MTASTQQTRHGTQTRRRPQRTCIACRQARDKRDLIRVVRGVSGAVSVDDSGKLSGRGAYLCANDTCWERGLRGSHLEHRLLIGTPLSAADRARIKQEAHAVIRRHREAEVVRS